MTAGVRVDRELCRQLKQQLGKTTLVHRALAERGIKVHLATVRSILNGRLDSRKGRATTSRFASRDKEDKVARLPAVNHPALTKKTTVYPHRVVQDFERVLKSGENSPKIGARVLKGKWKGMPIYTLTLEERATCPTGCHHWRSCFGNKMHFALRMDHTDPAFEPALIRQVSRLGLDHPGGFVVRLHVLGDFFSIRYVNLWRALLGSVPQLRVFGYSARWDAAADPIAAALVPLVMEQWDRFAIRFSDAPVDECATVSIEHPIQNPADAIVCPEQIGRTESCSSCALCWQSRRRVSFIQH